jgi:hypothetical protein
VVIKTESSKWNRRTINATLKRIVLESMTAAGFESSGEYNWIRRNLGDDGWQQISLTSRASWGSLHHVGIVVQGHLDSLAERLRCYDPLYRDQQSSGMSLPQFLMWANSDLLHSKELEVTSWEQLHELLPGVRTHLTQVVLPWLDRHATLKALNTTSTELLDQNVRHSPKNIDANGIDDVGTQCLIAPTVGAMCQNNRLEDMIEWAYEALALYRDRMKPENIRAELAAIGILSTTEYEPYPEWHETMLDLLVGDIRAGVDRVFSRDGFHPDLPELTYPEPAGPEPRVMPASADVATPDSGSARPAEVSYVAHQLKGCDADGEPTIRVHPDGTLEVVFEFMPPDSWDMNDNDVENLASDMSAAVGVEVVWEDRELPRQTQDDGVRFSAHRPRHG